ncbi:MAG: hypothetical protein ACHQZQ_08065 [SAR324 cluster bacterium]
MKRKTLVILGLIALFAVLVGTALWRELRRDADSLAHSITGRLDVDPQLAASGQADLARTDRVALILVDPETRHPVAMHFESPLVPPMNFRIGIEDARDGQALTGRYTLIAITDKDGEVFRNAPGEVYGQAERPVGLGDRQVVVTLSQPFRGTLFNTAPEAAAGAQAEAAPEPPEPPERTVSGTVRATPELAANVTAGDRMVIMLFDPEAGRPAAVKLVPVTRLPQAFSISVPPGQPLKAGYSLRILTDKDGNPFGSAPGEIVGRSSALVAPGTHTVQFVMDQPYVR